MNAPPKNDVSGLVAMALAHAAAYQHDHRLKEMHPAHQKILAPFLSPEQIARLGISSDPKVAVDSSLRADGES